MDIGVKTYELTSSWGAPAIGGGYSGGISPTSTMNVGYQTDAVKSLVQKAIDEQISRLFGNGLTFDIPDISVNAPKVSVGLPQFSLTGGDSIFSGIGEGLSDAGAGLKNLFSGWGAGLVGVGAGTAGAGIGLGLIVPLIGAYLVYKWVK